MSLRARLLLALGAVALIALLAADVATYSSLRSFLMGRVDQELQAAHEPIEAQINGQGGPYSPSGPGSGLPPGVGSGTDTTTNAQICEALQQDAQGIFVEVRLASNTVIPCPGHQFSGTAASPKLPTTITGYSTVHNEPTVYFDSPSSTDEGPSFRVRASKMANGDVLIVALPLTDTHGTLDTLLLIELAVTGGALVLAGLVGWYLVRVGLRPLAAIETTAANIARGELGHRVPGESPRTEVGRLAAVLNLMLGRIEDAFRARDATENQLRRSEGRMRQFVGDASHELRTPLAAVSAYAELFERGAKKRPEDLDRVMAGIRSEATRMGHLVDDLLLLARMDEGRPLERAPVEMVGLASEAVDAARAVGPDWIIDLDASQPVEVLGDRARLRQVLDNLLANTRAHTPPGTHVGVTIRSGDPDRPVGPDSVGPDSVGPDSVGASGTVVVEVADDGPGLDPATADRLFERFYRADASRSRASGGSGLGLSIVEAIVAGHGGTVSAGPRPSGGSVFVVRLPASPL